MKKALEISLGIVTSIGGFLDVGSIATAIAAGAAFGLELLWAIVLGTLCIIFIIEMTGRLAATSEHTLADAMRERFGFNLYLIPFLCEIVVDYLVLAAEIGGVSVAIHLVTGVEPRVVAFPVAIAVWLVLWAGSFKFIENGVALLGLVTIVFLITAVKLGPSLGELGAGSMPSLPHNEHAKYFFTAASILGAVISPYMLYFYSSGVVEDKWDKEHIVVNRAVAGIGMTFGGALSAALLVVAALVLKPEGIEFQSYDDAKGLLEPVLHGWGLPLLAAGLGIACFGAALEISLELAYIVAQTFGFNWGKSQKPAVEARFSLTYTLALAFASLPVALGLDPLELTLFSMALIALILPVVIGPLLILMNDRDFAGEHANGVLGNTVVLVVTAMAVVIAISVIPLEIMAGGS
jgi:Mn2+/Fe2+ NRAMP family transporter